MVLFYSKKYLKFFFFIVFVFSFQKITIAQFNQGNCPNNIDFEFGNFTNWGTSTGTVIAGPSYNWTGNVQVNNVHTILDAVNNAGQTDPYGGFPVLCPNGSGFSVKLGNNLTNAPKSQRLTYTFTIPNGTVRYSLTYFYAAVLNQGPAGNHNASNQARFVVNLIDQQTNLPLPCTDFDYNASGGAANGFVQSSTVPPSGPVFTKNWTPVTIDLSGLNGKTLTLEFITNNCSLQGHFGYAYIDVGATCITPVTGYAYCTGANSITLTAPFGYQSYIWYNQNYLPLGNNQTLTITPAPPNGTIYNIDLIPFPFGGCRDTLPVVTEEQTPPVEPVAQTDYTYCQNTPAVQLTATNLPGYLLQWYTTPTGGTGTVNAPTPSTAVVGATDYYVSQISFGGCEGPRKKITVNVVPPAITNFVINDTIQCISSNNFIFTNTSTDTGTVTTFTWNFGDLSPIVTGTNATHQYATVGSFNVTLTATKGLCITNQIIPITLVDAPTANFTFGNVCEGQAINFNNATTGGSISNAYLWDFGGGNTSTATNPSFTFTTPGIKNVKLSVTEGACTDDSTKQVTVYAVPKTNFTYTQACINDSIQFTDLTTLSLGAITSWNWDFGNGQTSTLQNPKMAFSTFGTQNVKLTVATVTCSKDTTIQVNVFEKPTAYFKRVDTACLNQMVQFQDSSYFASGAPSSSLNYWWWDAGNGSTYGSSNIAPTYSSVANNIVVSQVVRSANGCYSDTNTVLINVNPLPIARVNFLSNLCENRPLEFEDISSPNIMGRQWVFSSGFVSNAQKITVSNLNTGLQNLKLNVTDSFGCKSLNLDSNFVVFKRPRFDYEYKDSCVEKPVPFEAFDADGNYITNWYWNFEGQTVQGGINQAHQFSKYGINQIYAYTTAANGCVSDTVYHTIDLRYTPANAGKDVIAAANEAIQLSATGGVTYLWSPTTGLNNATAQNPIATNTNTTTYQVLVTSMYGCTSTDDVSVKIYKGPDIYVPTIFTPNNDGVNDVLKVTLVGIKTYKGIKIYNRYGKIMYQEIDANKSWNGIVRDKFADAGTYVFVAEGIDINGKTIIKKGTVILTR